MSTWTRIALGAAVVALAAVLFVVLRPDGGEDEELADGPPAVETSPEETTTAETAPTETAPDTTTGAAPPTTTEAEEGPQRVLVVVRNGQPAGGIVRAEAERGDRVVLVVRSDVSDHVHLHGYDLLGDVAPGQPARITFRADLTGVFEAELEDRRVPILELEVRP